MSQTEKVLQEISEKMDKLLRLQALEVVKGIEGEQGKIALLDSLGFRPIDIAKLLNKTPENINVQLGYIRKKKGEKKTKVSDKPQPVENASAKETIEVTIDQSKVEADKK
jgi:hypothetical protein